MAVTIEEITHWTRPWDKRGIGCIVVQDLGGYVVTACGSMLSGDVVTDKPKAVCRKCRAKLGELVKREPCPPQGS